MPGADKIVRPLPRYSFSIQRSLAQAERLLLAASVSEQVSGFFVRILAVGVFPHMQTGALGGHVQGCMYLRNACLTMRSSNE